MSTCSFCKYAQTQGEKTMAEQTVCRRYPPASHIIQMQTPPDVRNPHGGLTAALQVVFPTVMGDWSCGEFHPRQVSPLRSIG